MNANASNPTAANSPQLAPERRPGRLWTGRILSGFIVLFLGWDCALKLTQHPMAIAGTTDLGYSAQVIFPLGVVSLACLVLYLIPRTAILGAVLWTGYLGGAIATHVRVGNPLFSHVLFPIYVALFLWGGLALRDPRVMGLLAAPRRENR